MSLTDADRAAIIAELNRQTKWARTAPREEVRAKLMASGMYEVNGDLKPEYGGRDVYEWIDPMEGAS